VRGAVCSTLPAFDGDDLLRNPISELTVPVFARLR
jgi:hypothetical protein